MMHKHNFFKNADTSYRQILIEVLSAKGGFRETRSGNVKSVFAPSDFRYDMSDGTAPLLTGKQIFVDQMIGELLWFMNGETTIPDLKWRTWDDPFADRQTIWTPDQQRWANSGEASLIIGEDCGRLYGAQWRDSRGIGHIPVDQLSKLIRGLKENPSSRYHIVNSWNAAEIDQKRMALPPCHVMFQCYVSEDGELSLKWYQRSVDCFLGLPFNIASYGLLLSILCAITGYKPGQLIGTFGDAHIYENHMDAVKQYLDNETYPAPVMNLEPIDGLEQLSFMIAKDFKGCYQGYRHAGKISAPLSVG